MPSALWDNLAWILAALFIFGGGTIYSIVTVLSKNWRRARESEHLMLLKQSMIDKGMSPEDIERVLLAGLPPKSAPDQ